MGRLYANSAGGERGSDPIGEFREGERTSPKKSPPLTYFDFSVKEQRDWGSGVSFSHNSKMENVIGGRKESVASERGRGEGGLPWAPIYYTGGKRGDGLTALTLRKS